MGKLRLAGPLELLADPAGEPLASNLRAFRFVLLVHVAVQTWAFVVKPLRAQHLAMPRAGTIVAALVLTACCGLALTRFARLAPVLALPPLAWRLYWTMPWVPNHTFLVFLCVLLLAYLDTDRDDEGVLLLQSLRWIAIVVLFYTGFQKLIYGYWFRGEFLSWMISHGTDTWRSVFGWMLSGEELARLESLTFDQDSGPYRTTSTPLVLLSNFTWVAEIALAPLLWLRRTRAAAAIFTVGFVLLIQLAPREFMFFLPFTGLLLLFVPGGWNRRLAPVFVLLYLLLLGALAGVVPADFLVKATGRI